MLASLSIKNYALIENLQVDFTQGLTIITGETGAGKSILLGGLSLILGKRADLSALKNTENKCVIEAVFNVSDYDLEALFNKLDFDYDKQTIIRREILPSGKSRAFVNDSPVNLSDLQKLGEQLIDIHSQHQTLQLTDNLYQFQVIDALANNKKYLIAYKEALLNLKKAQHEYDELLKHKSESLKEHDYNMFLLQELQEIRLEENDLQALEEEYETLSNVEEIKESLAHANTIFNEDEIGVSAAMFNLKALTQKLSKFATKYQNIHTRIESVSIELDDIFTDLENLQDALELDPKQLEVVSHKLQVINSLLKKHLVNEVSELIEVRDNLEQKVSFIESLDDSIQEKLQEVNSTKIELDEIANLISVSRTKVLPNLISQLESILGQLGMPNAKFKITVNSKNEYFGNGKDDLDFLFSANKGGSFNELKKAASGGELSRIMLAIKSILANYIQLPAIMFDEIDSGVSGEVSNKMANIMLQMSEKMQVFTITHLPQIAAKGHTHFKVFKEDVDNVTQSGLRKLNQDDRIVEIAQMLGGKEISTSAVAHAKQLLN
ncbi:DNA repair protein RecN [Hanstruepera flava]|uniref:DNA repair protein RecN n=1 Tax=Hanstruepera flava TaxID=2930218 RepID=UPI0020278D88|nr:DNA repair protein RecN [Hanstruepera flava]